MEKQLFVVKERTEYMRLLTELSDVANETTRRMGVNINWLQCAVKGKFVYHFLPDAEDRWKVLHKIAQSVSESSNYSFGTISDTLSYLVNTSIEDEIFLHDKFVIPNLDNSAKSYIENLLIELYVSKTFIPRHVWFKYIKKEGDNWLTLNLSDAKKYSVERKVDRKFVTFTLSMIEESRENGFRNR